MALAPEQKSRLWQAKLAHLARESFSRTAGSHHALPWGAALGDNGVWTVLVEAAPARSFGHALAFIVGHQNGHDAASVDLLVDGDTAGIVARRAELFSPSAKVWRVDGTTAAPAHPTPYGTVAAPALRPDLAKLLTIDEVAITVEHGIIRGECRGLEVARISGEGDEQRLDVGVGAYDQGAFAVMNPDLTPSESLGVVVRRVLEHRRRGAPPHPINRLVRERWLRHELLADPGRVGLEALEAIEPTSPRGGLNEVIAACALGADASGAKVLVACSSGIDLDAVPEAADLAGRHEADRITMVVADRDRHRLVLAMAARSRRPIDFVSAAEPWTDR